MDYAVFDAHCDTLCYALDKNARLEKNDYHVDFNRLSRYRSYTQIFACYIAPVYSSCAEKRTMDLIDTFYRSKRELPMNVNAILSIEGGEGIYSLSALRNYYRLGVRIAALTWNETNHLAAGAMEKDDSMGLTAFGAEVVREMNRIGMLIDVSHLNRKSFYDVARVSNMPIIATHSCSDKICRHPRNLTDDQFELIKQSEGVCGINFYPPFLSEDTSCTIDDIIKHIDHFMSLGGEDNIGIGADFDGVDALPRGIGGAQDMYKVFDALLKHGYSEEQVEKISHKNFERIFSNA